MVLREWDSLLSLGHFYGFAAEWAGLSVWDAGKLMGLAAYGRSGQRVSLTRTPDGYDMPGRPEPHERVAFTGICSSVVLTCGSSSRPRTTLTARVT